MADAITREAARRSGAVELHSVRATSPEEVEVVYSDRVHMELRGFRISSEVVRSARSRIRDSSIDELAFDIVTTGVWEPRPSDDFLDPDTNGVRWLSIPGWLDEIT